MISPRAVTLFVQRKNQTDEELALLQGELSLLLGNLGVAVGASVVQRRETPDPAYYIGQGKAEEAAAAARAVDARLLVCDDVLSPSQLHHLTQLTKLEVWDRARVIMRLFDARAHSAEAKLQIDLARCRMELPSLKGLGQQMSRTGGGIGTRGPGETEFERHRRKLNRRERDIQKRLDMVRQRRQGQRDRRRRRGFRTVALVGYTNSGKSTLLRSLSGDPSVFVADKLFATLDTAIRHVALPSGERVLLADTVGFVRKLPHALVAAFRATLEEVQESDLLLIVLDVTAQDIQGDLEVVQSTLRDLGAGELPRVLVLNKEDLVDDEVRERLIQRWRQGGETVLAVSALRGTDLEHLCRIVDQKLSESGKAEKSVPAS